MQRTYIKRMYENIHLWCLHKENNKKVQKNVNKGRTERKE